VLPTAQLTGALIIKNFPAEPVLSVVTLLCSKCGGVSHRPSGFVAARASFMCDHCRSLVRIAPADARDSQPQSAPLPLSQS
jgi:hypothetical protein